MKNLNLNKPVTGLFFKIYKFNIFLYIFFFFFIIFFLIFFSLFIFYHFLLKNNKYFFLKNIFLEFFWIFIPFYAVSLIFFYSVFIFLKIKKIHNVFLNIKIISYQWKWYFVYLNRLKRRYNFFSIISNCVFKILNFNITKKNYNLQNVDNKLILPINKIVRFIFFSNDVVHSLYVPSFGLKQDSIPSFLKNFYFKSKKMGKYYGFCTELCGKNHSYMPFILKVLSVNSYKKWELSIFLKNFLILNY